MITPSGPSSGGSLFKRVSGAVSLKDPTDSFDVPTGRCATVVVAAVDSLHKEAADYVCDGGSDDDVLWQSIIDNIADGSQIVAMEGHYDFSDEVLIQNRNNLNIAGVGYGTVFRSTGNNTLFTVGHRTDANLASNRIVFEKMKIDGTTQAITSTTPEILNARFGIQIASPAGESADCVIRDCWIYNTGSDGIYGWSPGNTTIQQNLISHVRGYWGGVHAHQCSATWLVADNNIHHCVRHGIRHGMIVSNIVHHCGQASPSTAAVVGCPGPVIANEIKNSAGHSFESHQACSYQNIIGNRMVDPGNNHIILNGDHQAIVGNLLKGGWRGIDTKSDIFSDNTFISGNKISDTNDVAISMRSSDNVNIQNNSVDAAITSAGTGVIVRNNQGFVTENSGTDTVTAAATTKNVTHGLAVTPAAGDITIVPTGAWGAVTQFHISAHSSSTFTVTVDQVPGAPTFPFAWKAIVL